jgi:hypothetical protein
MYCASRLSLQAGMKVDAILQLGFQELTLLGQYKGPQAFEVAQKAVIDSQPVSHTNHPLQKSMRRW